LVSVRHEADQARYVAEAILENRERGILLKTQAVLFRASHHSAPLEIELKGRNIPFVKFGGLKFLEAAHIKDVLACLRWAENARDRVAGFRVIQLLPGVGPATAARLLDRVAEAQDVLQAILDFDPPTAAAEAWSPFVQMIRVLAGNPPDGLRNLISFTAGTFRIWIAFTKTPSCAKPIWCSSARSLRLIQHGSAFSQN
jgi:DNA helicase-2/ATP-dependent DNA helicase PcrA